MPVCVIREVCGDNRKMEDYNYTIDTIQTYKNKACEIAKNNCETCEARQEYKGKYYCCFDTTIRFIEYANNNLIK